MVTSVAVRIFTLLFLLIIGAFARYKRIIKDDTVDSLIAIVIKISLPSLYFYSLSRQTSLETLKRLWFLPLSAVLVIGTGYLLAILTNSFLNLEETKKKTYLFMASFTNYGFLAIPVCYVLFGERGLFQIIIFNLGFNIMFWTFGIWLLSNKKGNPAKNLINPGTISLTLGVLVGIFSIKMPVFLMDAAKMLGNSAIPLAMLTVGAILAKSFGKKAMNPKTLTTLCLSRLVIVPLIILFVTGLFKDLPFMARAIIVLQAAMPTPAMTPLIARRFGGDPEFASTGVLFTTLFSLVTVSIFMHLVGA